MIPPSKTSLRKTLGNLVGLGLAGGVAYGQPYRLHSLSEQGENMSFIAWIVVGLIAGFIGSKIVNRRGEGIILDILLGIAGAFAGGWLFQFLGAPGVSGVNLYSIFVSVIGSIVLLILYHAVRRSRTWGG
jgi:uncharacterized membrane protein YeaQ/YmgE (transglycosylase-associated protein family)